MELLQAHLADLAVADLEQHAVAHDAGVVDEAVKGTEVFADLGEGLFNGGFVGDVAAITAALAAGLFHQAQGVVEGVLVHVNQGQLGPLAGQHDRHGLAQTTGGAGHGDHSIVHFHRYSSKSASRDEKSLVPLPFLLCI